MASAPLNSCASRLSLFPFKLDLPVVDRNGIEGNFDFALKLTQGDKELKAAFEGMSPPSWNRKRVSC